MAESTIGSSTKGEALVEFLDRPKKPTKTPMVGAGMASGTTNRGMKSGTSMDNGRDNEYFLGYGFDAAVRVGVDNARNAFINRIKNLDEGKKEVLIRRFDTEIASQKSLRKDAGLGAGMEKSYRDAAKTKTELSLDYATRARNARAIKSAPRNINNALNQAFSGGPSQF